MRFRLCFLIVSVMMCGFGASASAGSRPDSTVLGAAGVRALLLAPEAVAAAVPFGPASQAGARRRSIPLAFGLSAAVPGLGQAYNRHWIKAAVFVALEGVLIVGYRDARRQGLDEEDAYEAYAHQFWSPLQYAHWLEDYSDWLPTTDRMDVNDDLVAGIDFTRPEAWTADETRRVRAFFDEIHLIEAAVIHPETGASFSHKLPYFGQQQYYELIGKYFQFAPGWEDYPAWKVGDAFTDAIDPERTGPNGEKVNVRGRFLAYDDLTEHANDLLRRASRISAVLLANHVFAAIDAAVFAKLHNDRIQTDLTLAYDADGTLRPHAAVRLRL